MRRDMDLYRKILFRAEETDPTEQVGAREIEGDDATIYAHIQLLADEGLVEIVDYSSNDELNACRVSRITAKGHDFLAETRDPDRWESIKQAATQYGPLTLSTIQTAINAM